MSRPVTEPEPTRWHLPDPAPTDGDLVAIGADLEPGTILAAYRQGLFPMPVEDGRRRELGWWSPDPRAIIPLDRFHVSRSLRASLRRYDVTIDRAFAQVVDQCRGLRRPGGWITPEVADAYKRLHGLGWAHSIESWHDGRLVGGLYGLGQGRLFAGESMFHIARDASKVALAHLVERMRERPDGLLDVQWLTPHLASLGAVPIRRQEYLALVRDATEQPQDRPFSTDGQS